MTQIVQNFLLKNKNDCEAVNKTIMKTNIIFFINYHTRLAIYTILSIAFFMSCGGLVSLKLPPQDEITEDNSWLTLGRNAQHQHYASKDIAPPLAVAWKTNVKSVVADHPLALGNYILVPTLNGTMYMLDYDTGERLSDGKLGPAISNAPTIFKNRMYAGLSLGKKTLVSYELKKADKVLNEPYPNISTTPLIEDQKIFFGTNQNTFYCVNVENGEKIWEFKTNAPIHSSPAYHTSEVVFADEKGWLYSLDESSGVKFWEIHLQGNIFSHPVLDDSSVYIGTVAGEFYRINLKTGKIIWQRTLDGAIYSSPALYQNVLYVGTNGRKVLALNKKTGNTVWEFKTEGIVNTVPLPSPDYVYVTSWDRHLYVLNRFTGKLVFKLKFKRVPKSSPIIFRDYVLIHTANDKIFALANEKMIKERKERSKKK